MSDRPDVGFSLPVRERLASADLRVFRFLQAWREARDGGPIPRRRAFDPMAAPDLLPWIWLYAWEPDSDDFRCRLAGEQVNAAWGRSIRGLTLHDVVGATDHPTIRARWRRILDELLVHYGARTERLSALETRRAERLLAPLADDAGAARYVLGLSLYAIEASDPTRPALKPDDSVQFPCTEV